MMAEVTGNGIKRTKRKYAKEFFKQQAIYKKNYKKYWSMGIIDLMSGVKRKQRFKLKACARRLKEARHQYNCLQVIEPLFTT